MNRYRNNDSDFFITGGTMPHNSPSYVKRPADDELFKLALAGTFCYVLTPRQMGKSSLMIHTAHRLQAQGVETAIIDLTQIGSVVTVEQWYLSLLNRLKRHLRLVEDPIVWWQARSQLGHVQRFIDFLRNVVLGEIQGQIVIFIDEIDVTLNLDFTDDFFAVIRAMYNARADEPKFNRLTFVLLGVATPSDLIKDRTRTPFNIGQRIVLEEFSRSNAIVLQEGLEAVYPGEGQAIFECIYYWTSGHPYLTQKLCSHVANDRGRDWSDKQIDRLVLNLFQKDGPFKDYNLQFVQNGILKSAQKEQLLNLYQKVHRGQKVSNDPRLIIQNHLKLLGLVKVEDGFLSVRNRIYRRVFDLDWVKKHRNIQGVFQEDFLKPWGSITATVTIIVTLLVLGSFAYNGWLNVQAQNDLQTTPTLRPMQMLTRTPSATLTLLAEVRPNFTPSTTGGTPSFTEGSITVTPNPTSVPAPLVPTNTPLVPPTAIFVPTKTPLVPISYPSPVLLTPQDHVAISQQPTLLQWSWDGTLQEDEYFDVRVWREGDPAWGIAWTKETSFLFDPAIAGGGDYLWSITIIRGQDGQWQADLSDPATPRHLYIITSWGGDSKDDPKRPTSTPPP